MGDGPSADVILAGVRRWRQEFEDGDIRFHGLFTPKLEDGERPAGFIMKVHHEMGVTPGSAPEELGPAVLPKTDGAAKVTDRRLILAGNFRNVVHTWWWRDVAATRVIRPAMGVTIEGHDGRIDRIGNVWHATIPGARPDDNRTITRWLEVEAAFAASQGSDALEAWFGALPGRLAAGLR